MKWGAAFETARCHRCHKAGRVPVGTRASRQLVFCTEQCREWHEEEIRIGQLDRQNARIAMRKWERVELLRKTPLHVLYPDMLAVLDWAQRQRPSYVRWSGEQGVA